MKDNEDLMMQNCSSQKTLRNDFEKLTISIEEAAKIIGVSKKTMLKLAKLEGFPALQLKRKIIINKEQFIKWFNNLTENSLVKLN